MQDLTSSRSFAGHSHIASILCLDALSKDGSTTPPLSVAAPEVRLRASLGPIPAWPGRVAQSASICGSRRTQQEGSK
jgi:hypothetical protein